MQRFKVKLTFVEEALGTTPGNEETFTDFVLSKRPDQGTDDETESLPPVEAEIEKGSTLFPRLPDGVPFVYDYQVKGFFKDACGSLRRADDTHSKGLKAYRKEIDGLIFVSPRKIPLVLPVGGKVGICERPLRSQGPTGERVCLSRSESVPAGTTLEFEVSLLADKLEEPLHEWLAYGQLRGMLQWRNSGKGRFLTEVTYMPSEQ